ncbi:hypothetical protein ONZ45_g10466 [Pleurotus djamor]|nr:hypothetical protein ONZ45_g10466 [Pleurotus djamor]
MESLPLELWYKIFHHAVGPLDDFDRRLLRWKPISALVERLCIPKLRTATQLVRVCKHWNEIITPLLYENLIISTATQLRLALTTLESRKNRRGTQNLGHSVKRIVIAFAKYVLVNSSDFHRLLSYCPDLIALHLTRYFQLDAGLSLNTILQTARTLEVLNLGGAYLISSQKSSWTDLFTKMPTLRAARYDLTLTTSSPIPPNIEFLSLTDHPLCLSIPSSVTELVFYSFGLPPYIDLSGTSMTKLTLICQFNRGDPTHFGDSFRQLIASIPPSVKALSLLPRSWDDLTFINALPKNITFLGLDAQLADSVVANSSDPLPLVEFCESVEAPALETVQFLHWDDCDHLRKHHPDVLEQLTSALRKRNVDLIDWEGIAIV